MSLVTSSPTFHEPALATGCRRPGWRTGFSRPGSRQIRAPGNSPPIHRLRPGLPTKFSNHPSLWPFPKSADWEPAIERDAAKPQSKGTANRQSAFRPRPVANRRSSLMDKSSPSATFLGGTDSLEVRATGLCQTELDAALSLPPDGNGLGLP